MLVISTRLGYTMRARMRRRALRVNFSLSFSLSLPFFLLPFLLLLFLPSLPVLFVFEFLRRLLLVTRGGRKKERVEAKKKESGRLRGLYVVMYKEGCFAVYPREVTWKKNANVAKKVALSFASTRKREGKTRSIEKSELETVVDSNRGNSDIFDHRYYRWMDFDPRFGKFDLNRRVIFSG